MATASPDARRSQGISTTTSIIEDHGSYVSSCGYCDREGPTSKSHGMHAHVCSVEDYQSLLDRGWRRSGSWMYRPHLNDTCCPPFTIRLDACAFAPTKSQRKVEKRWRRYLDGELDDDGKRIDEGGEGDKDASRGGERHGADASGVSASASCGDRDAEMTRAAEMRDADATRKKKTVTTKKKKKRSFEIREAPSSFDEEEYQLWRRYQISVHGDDEGSLSKTSYRRFLVDTPLRLREAPVAEPERFVPRKNVFPAAFVSALGVRSASGARSGANAPPSNRLNTSRSSSGVHFPVTAHFSSLGRYSALYRIFGHAWM